MPISDELALEAAERIQKQHQEITRLEKLLARAERILQENGVTTTKSRESGDFEDAIARAFYDEPQAARARALGNATIAAMVAPKPTKKSGKPGTVAPDAIRAALRGEKVVAGSETELDS